jgi:serine phosphatase RsbU (regulator of sigma subunit)
MNKPFTRLFPVAFLAFLLVIGVLSPLTSCHQKTPRSDSVKDSLNKLIVDSLLNQQKARQDYKVKLALIDSIEKVGLMGEIRANYERGSVYNFLRQGRQSEQYWKKAVNAEIRSRTEERVFFLASAMLANLYQVNHNFEAALRQSIKTLNRMKQSDLVMPRLIGVQLVDIGICQLKMRRYDDAAKSFEESTTYFRKGIATDTTFLSYENTLACTNNTILFYLDAQLYHDADYCLNHLDSMLAMYKASPLCREQYYDDQYARRCSFKSRTLLGLGQKEEANKMFEIYRSSESYQSGREHAPGEFLMAAHRYAEATEAYADIEEQIRQRVGKPSLDIIQQYLFPKYRANAGAGYKDSALAVGLRIFDYLDSAIVWQKQDDAAELATIYETQEKDRQIAEQEVALSKQRYGAAAVFFAIIVLALAIFIFFRHRAAKRLEVAHEELKVAYDQLEETTAVKERIQSELRIARDIQMSMVPHEFPQLKGLDMYGSMMPAKEVGGDLYGYILQGDNLYFCVGDVSGKSVPASLFMAQATRLFRTLASQGMMPADICTQMNDALSGEDNVSGMFVTFFLGLVNLKTGHLTFCNAGHNPPVIGGGDHRGDFLEMESNAPIGLWPGLQFAGEEIDSITNRPLFLYTDGLNEAENNELEQFGNDRMLTFLRNSDFNDSRDVIERLAAEVERHRAGNDPNDDLTMLCIKVTHD